jgi:hypothetical protein
MTVLCSLYAPRRVWLNPFSFPSLAPLLPSYWYVASACTREIPHSLLAYSLPFHVPVGRAHPRLAPSFHPPVFSSLTIISNLRLAVDTQPCRLYSKTVGPCNVANYLHLSAGLSKHIAHLCLKPISAIRMCKNASR